MSFYDNFYQSLCRIKDTIKNKVFSGLEMGVRNTNLDLDRGPKFYLGNEQNNELYQKLINLQKDSHKKSAYNKGKVV